jgi:hypothetical protein
LAYARQLSCASSFTRQYEELFFNLKRFPDSLAQQFTVARAENEPKYVLTVIAETGQPLGCVQVVLQGTDIPWGEMSHDA